MHDTFKKTLIKFGVGLIASIVIIAILLQEYNIHKMTRKTSTEQFTLFLDSYINAEMKEFDIPGASIAIIKDSGIVWQNAYGYADIENSVEMTTDTICRVQSISKPVTAWGIIKLAEAGQLDLDKPLGLYVRSIQLPGELHDTTIRHLLSHTSGLALGDVMQIYSPLEGKPTLRENLEKEMSVNNEPGVFSYSNVGFNLLELVIEDVTGREFSEYMENEVQKPLGMDQSTFSWNPQLNIPSGYGLSGKAIPVYVYPEKASGGLFATAGDLALFAMAGMDVPSNEYKVISRESINSMYRPASGIRGLYSLVFDAYGLGYFLEDPENGLLSVSHGGQGTGIMTHIQFYPDSGDGIVILTNSQRSWPFIASVLRVWAGWNGYTPPGMTRILLARCIFLLIISIGFFLVAVMLWKLTGQIIKRKRVFMLNSGRLSITQIGQLLFFLLVVGTVAWNVSRPYSTLASLFPVISIWFWIILTSAAVCSFLYAIFPPKKHDGMTDR